MCYGMRVMFPVFKQQNFLFKVKGILLLLNVICSPGKEIVLPLCQ